MKVKIKILKPLRSYVKDQIVDIPADKKGVPLERYWRRRFKDAEIDKCLHVLSASEVKALEEAKKELQEKRKKDAEEKAKSAKKKEGGSK